MTTIRINGNESNIAVERVGDKVSLSILSSVQGSHTVNHVVLIRRHEDALAVAEALREAATAAKIYEEHNPQ